MKKRYLKKSFLNITKAFFQFLINEANNPESVFNLMILGMRRAGKTVIAFLILVYLMIDKRRKICLYRQPKELFEVFAKFTPWGIGKQFKGEKKGEKWEKYKKALEEDLKITYFMNRIFNNALPKFRFYEAHRLSEIQNNSIVYMDESLVSANAKEALKTEMRELGKSNSYWSHKRIILIMNAQDDGVIKDLRNKCEIKIYKRLTINFVERSRDPFIQKNKEKIKVLSKKRGIIDSNLFHFTKRGYIEFDQKKELPWFCRELSMNLANASADALLEQMKQKQDELTPIVDKIIKDLGRKRMLKSGLNPLIQGYMLEEDHLEWYNNFKTSIPEIAARCKYRALKMKDDPKDDEEEEGKEIIFEEGDSFGLFCLNNLPTENRINEVFHLLVQGTTQRVIRDALVMSIGKISGIVKSMSEKEIGYYFEDWFATTHGGGEVAHNVQGKPDYIDPDGNIYSLKYRYDGSKCLSFYQKENLGPEYRAAKELGKTYFLGLYNPRWYNKLQLKEIDPERDDNKVDIYNEK